MKALLINPSTDYALNSEAADFPSDASGAYPPLGLLYLQGAAEKSGEHKVDIVDGAILGHLENYIENHSKDALPDVVGITVMTPNLVSVARAIAKAKSSFPTSKIILGGPHVGLFPTQTINLDSVDYVFIGEAEESFVTFLNNLEKGDKFSHPAGVYSKINASPDTLFHNQVVENLDSLPFPDRTKIGVENYRGLAGKNQIFTTMLFGRGCPFKCTFCSTPRGNTRFRNPHSVVEEMEICANQGVEHLYFLDDCFPSKGQILNSFCDSLTMLKKKLSWSCRTTISGLNETSLRAMKNAGCIRIQLGVETGTDEGLKVLGKMATVDKIRNAFDITHKVGMETLAYFMIGLPNEKTAKDVERTIGFAKRLRPDFAMFNVLTIYPGTPLFDQAVKKGIVEKDFWIRFAENPDPTILPPVWTFNLSRNELFDLQNKAYRAFYWQPRMLLKQLFAGGGIRGIIKRLRVGLAMLLFKNSAKGQNQS